jgi:hypothetical protein
MAMCSDLFSGQSGEVKNLSIVFKSGSLCLLHYHPSKEHVRLLFLPIAMIDTDIYILINT